MASGEDEVMATAGKPSDAIPDSEGEDELSQTSPILQHRPKELVKETAGMNSANDEQQDDSTDELTITVKVPTAQRPWEYMRIPEDATVVRVIEEVPHPGNELWYRIEYRDDREENVSISSSIKMGIPFT